MYANILLSTDGSDVARKGIEQGLDLAKALNAKVTVVAVTGALPIDLGGGHAGPIIPRRRNLIALTRPAKSMHVKFLTRPG